MARIVLFFFFNNVVKGPVQGIQGIIYPCKLFHDICIFFNRMFPILAGIPYLSGNFIQFDTQCYNKIKHQDKSEIFIAPVKKPCSGNGDNDKNCSC